MSKESEAWYLENKQHIAAIAGGILASGRVGAIIQGAKTYEDACTLIIEDAAQKVALLDKKCGIEVPTLPTTCTMTPEELAAELSKPQIIV
jgi:hypothetical protein